MTEIVCVCYYGFLCDTGTKYPPKAMFYAFVCGSKCLDTPDRGRFLTLFFDLLRHFTGQNAFLKKRALAGARHAPDAAPCKAHDFRHTKKMKKSTPLKNTARLGWYDVKIDFWKFRQ